MLRPENHQYRPSSSESMDPPDPASRAPCHKKSQLVAGAGVAAPYLRTTCPGRPCVDVRQGVVGSVGWVMVEAVGVGAARPGRGQSGGGEIVFIDRGVSGQYWLDRQGGTGGERGVLAVAPTARRPLA